MCARCVVIALCSWLSLSGVTARAADSVDFVKDVRPILQRHCVKCHGPDKQEGSLRLDQKESALRGGDNYHPAIKPKESSASPLMMSSGMSRLSRWMCSATGAIFSSAMIGGGIIFIDDKSRGLHEGYLVTPIRRHWSMTNTPTGV